MIGVINSSIRFEDSIRTKKNDSQVPSLTLNESYALLCGLPQEAALSVALSVCSSVRRKFKFGWTTTLATSNIWCSNFKVKGERSRSLRRKRNFKSSVMQASIWAVTVMGKRFHLTESSSGDRTNRIWERNHYRSRYSNSALLQN